MLCLSKCSYQVKLFQFQFNFLYFSFQHKQEIIENNDVTIHQANCLQSLYFGIRQMMKALNCISLRVVLDVDNDMYVNGHLNDCSVLDKVDIACNLREAIQAVNEFLGAFETEQNGMIKGFLRGNILTINLARRI
ncbi:uncharacterized protein LOC144571306 isoform X4 [Carex rostrata]